MDGVEVNYQSLIIKSFSRNFGHNSPHLPVKV